jgi:uncharacterized protein (DUF1810 family)
MSDPFDLQRFVDAQVPVYARVVAELKVGRKASHWMWFIFPQIAGPGSSAMSRRFSIGSSGEAVAYLAHPILGPRLRECTMWVNAVRGLSAREILGSPDDMKFHSSMTLFAQAGEDNQIFLDALQQYFGGVPDRRTLEKV